jgi:uncharacterized damage-inducible protein DinB
MSPAEAHDLIDYHYWARDRLLDAVAALSPEQFVRDMGNSFKSVRDTVAHIYGAEYLWCGRWTGAPPAGLPDPGQFPDLGSIRTAWHANEAKMRAFFHDLGADGVNRAMEYTSPAGKTSTAVLAHMLQHVVNHASYHRGQVTTMLRQLGAAPPKSMDLIAFYRGRER